MLIPADHKLILDPLDDFTHAPEPASNYNESMYFNAFDKEQGVGLWMRIGNRPNEGHAEVTCCVYLPDGSVGFMYQRPKISDNLQMNAGGMRFEVVAPFEHFRVSYGGELLLMANPHDMIDPSRAFKTNPKVTAVIDLDYRGISPMYGGEIVKMDGSPRDLDPMQSVHRGHTEQFVQLSGTVRIGERTFTIADGTGYRDKSWGPRFWHNYYWYRWLPVAFDRDFGVILAIKGRKGDAPTVSGNIFENGTLEPVIDATLEIDWSDEYHHRSFEAVLRTQRRSYTLTGDVEALVPLRHKAVPGTDPNTYTRILEAMTTYRCEGRTTLAMSEFCDLMTNGVPISHRLGLGQYRP